MEERLPVIITSGDAHIKAASFEMQVTTITAFYPPAERLTGELGNSTLKKYLKISVGKAAKKPYKLLTAWSSPYVHLILLVRLSFGICQRAPVCEGEPLARDIPTVCKYECEPIASLIAT